MSCPSAVAVVGDVSITHPFLGKGSRSAAPWGHHLPGRVRQCAGAKNRLYRVMHAEQNLLFVPLVGTTFGSQGADAVVLLFILAHRATEAYFTARGWNPFTPAGQYSAAFCSHRGRFNNRFSARISLALCRSSGGRALARASAHYDGTADIDDDAEFVSMQAPAVGRPQVPPRA